MPEMIESTILRSDQPGGKPTRELVDSDGRYHQGVILVDKFGLFYTEVNPVPVSIVPGDPIPIVGEVTVAGIIFDGTLTLGEVDVTDRVGRLLGRVRDAFTAIEHTPDQNGAGAVLEFTLSAASDFVMVDVDNTDPEDTDTYRARATVDGSTPTATLGFVCRSGQTTYLPFPMTGALVKVFAPAGTTVAVQVGRY